MKDEEEEIVIMRDVDVERMEVETMQELERWELLNREQRGGLSEEDLKMLEAEEEAVSYEDIESEIIAKLNESEEAGVKRMEDQEMRG